MISVSSSFSFYIILRGKVSIMVKEDHDHDDKEEHGEASSDDDDDVTGHTRKPAKTEYRREEDRSKLGHLVGHLSECS